MQSNYGVLYKFMELQVSLSGGFFGTLVTRVDGMLRLVSIAAVIQLSNLNGSNQPSTDL